ncbi:MAG: histidine phosphatase family protein [Cyanobacteria bacterium RM1_2_2]|nr:histidine phosphatase family protein [Cyanobacteria bacterium RM1_2_2]
MLTLWLIRHGETAGNAAMSAQAETQLSQTVPMGSQTAHASNLGTLTQRGQRQSMRIAETVTHCPNLIVTSPLWRTKQTAEPTCQRFPTASQTEWPVQEFSYLAAECYQNANTPEQRRWLDQDYWQPAIPNLERFCVIPEIRCFPVKS